MKKIFIFLFLNSLFIANIFACDSIETEIYWIAETIDINNIRTKSCKESEKIWQTQIWEIYEVFAEAWDYYKISIDWKFYFIYKDWVNFKKKIQLSQEEEKLYEKIKKNFENKDLEFLKKLENQLYYASIYWKNYKNLIENLIIFTEEKIKFLKEQEEQKEFMENLSDEVSEIWKYWLSLYNEKRTELWLSPLKYDIRLQKSAEVWADISAKRWYYSHRRDPNDDYYDFNKIQNWFKNNWVNCKIENRTWAVENIWYWTVNCKNKDDCLENMKETVKRTFNNYLKEAWTSNDAHYKSMTSPYLNYMWFWVAFQSLGWNNYWLYNVTHFCTNFND